jgi:predicted glycogen debranching enzyme
MIALPGLLLQKGDEPVYLEVLETFASNQRQGIIPNFLGEDPNDNAYNSADAALWLGWALQQYLYRYSQKIDRIPSAVKAALEQTFHRYREGTDHGIGMLENGLLRVGSLNEQVTWMDATVNGAPVTPRWGCPVEINALWYNFICFLAEVHERLGIRSVVSAGELAGRVKKSFNSTFWLEAQGYLADVVWGDDVDASVRPNQIFAVSLPFSPLDKRRSQSVVEKVKSELMTRFGLRTLSKADARYRGRYEGGPEDRDSAYHNGTVWPWLLGHFGEALLKVTEDKTAAVEELEGCLGAIEEHLGEAGLGTVSEIFDGEPPHTPRGCISQAWSVAEILRLSGLLEMEKKSLCKERS